MGGAGGLYAGAYQMGPSALQSTGFVRPGGDPQNPNAWTGQAGVNSLQDYLGNQDAQNLAAEKLALQNLDYLKSKGAVTPQTSPEDQRRAVAAAHGVGAAGSLQGAKDAWGTPGSTWANAQGPAEAPTTVNIQGVGLVSFPSSMKPAEIQAAIEGEILPKFGKSPPQPGIIPAALHGAGMGLIQGGGDWLQTIRSIYSGQPGGNGGEETSPAYKKLAAPLDWSLGLPNLAKISYHIANTLARSSPEMGAFLAGSAAGGGPEEPLGLATGVGAVGVMGALQKFGPYLADALKANPKNPNQAWDSALEDASASGALDAASFGLFKLGATAGPIKHLLFQALGVQPAIGVAGTAATSLLHGKTPSLAELGQSAGEAALATVVPAAAHFVLPGGKEGVNKPVESPLLPAINDFIAEQRPLPPGQEPVAHVNVAEQNHGNPPEQSRGAILPQGEERIASGLLAQGMGPLASLSPENLQAEKASTERTPAVPESLPLLDHSNASQDLSAQVAKLPIEGVMGSNGTEPQPRKETLLNPVMDIASQDQVAHRSIPQAPSKPKVPELENSRSSQTTEQAKSALLPHTPVPTSPETTLGSSRLPSAIDSAVQAMRARGRQGGMVADAALRALNDRTLTAPQIYAAFQAGDVLSRILPATADHRVQFVNKILSETAADKAALRASGGTQAQGKRVSPTTGLDGLIMLAMEGAHTQETAAHEAMHVVEDYLRSYDKNSWNILDHQFHLESHYGAKDLDAGIRRSLQSIPSPRDPMLSAWDDLRSRLGASPVSGREWLAYTFGAFDAARDAGLGPVGGLRPAVRRVFNALHSIRTSLRNGLRGLGFRTAQDVLNSVSRGDYRGNIQPEPVNPSTRPTTPIPESALGVHPEAAIHQKHLSAPSGAEHLPPEAPQVMSPAPGPVPEDSFNNGAGANPSETESHLASPPPGGSPEYGLDQYHPLTQASALSSIAKLIPGDKSTIDRVRRLLQDYMLPFQRFQEASEKAGVPVNPAANVYRVEERSHGRISQRQLEAKQHLYEPLLRKLAENGITTKEFGKALYARHAPERNLEMAKRNRDTGNFQDVDLTPGSGMATSEANQHLGQILSGPKGNAYREAFQLFDKITRDTTRIRVEGGLISKNAPAASHYRYYAPLKGWAEEPDILPFESPRSGSYKGVLGKEDISPTGRSSEPGDILNHAIMQHSEAISRAENNAVKRSIYELAQQHPNVFEIDSQHQEPFYNQRTGQVQMRLARDVPRAENTVAFKDNGQVHYITIHDPDLARAAGKLGVMQLGGFFKSLAKVTRVLSALNTTWSPEFWITQGARTAIESPINAAAIGRKGLPSAIIRNMPAAYKGMYRYKVQGKADTPWAKAAEDMHRQGGGMTDYLGIGDIRGIESQLRDMWSKYDPSRSKLQDVKQGIAAVGNYISQINHVLDGGDRLATYVTAKQFGYTPEEAAQFAKNSTVNYSRRGEWGSAINSVKMFYNASAQTAARMFQTLNSPAGRKIAAGMIMLGGLSEYLNQMSAPVNPDGTNSYDALDDRTKDFNLVLPSLFSEPGNYHPITIPLPIGFRLFHLIGRNVMRMMFFGDNTRNTPWNASKDILENGWESFNPIGGASTLVGHFMPTLMQPFIDLAANKNYFGQPIVPAQSKYGVPRPESQMAWRNTPEMYRALAEGMNAATGGTSVRPGAVDVSPDAIKYLVNFFTGSVGGTVDRFKTIGLNVADKANILPDALKPKQPLGMNDIPFARRVLASVNPHFDQVMFDSALADTTYAQREAKEGGARNLSAGERVKLGLAPLFQATDKQIQSLRSTEKKVEAGKLNSAQKQQIQSRLDTLIQTLQQRANKVYHERVTQ